MEARRSVGASSCNSGDGTDQRVQSLVFYDDDDDELVSLEERCFYYGYFNNVLFVYKTGDKTINILSK